MPHMRRESPLARLVIRKPCACSCSAPPPSACRARCESGPPRPRGSAADRSEEHTSELQSLMRISYAVFCLKKKKKNTHSQLVCKQKQKLNNLTLSYDVNQYIQ